SMSNLLPSPAFVIVTPGWRAHVCRPFKVGRLISRALRMNAAVLIALGAVDQFVDRGDRDGFRLVLGNVGPRHIFYPGRHAATLAVGAANSAATGANARLRTSTMSGRASEVSCVVA